MSDLERVHDAIDETVRQSLLVEMILAETGDVVNVASKQEEGVARFYVENTDVFQYDNSHHIIDLRDGGRLHSSLKITQMGRSIDDLGVVTLEANEVDALLHVLLKWRMNHCEPQTREQIQAALDDHLF